MIRACKVSTCPELHSNENGYCDKHQNLVANRPCKTPGCPGMAVFRGMCEQCAELAAKHYETQRYKQNARAYNADWRKRSRAYLAQHPACEQCEARGIMRDAVLVHHVRPILEGGDRFDDDNLQSLCRECHEIIHKRKRPR